MAVVVRRLATPIPGVGISAPLFWPPILAAIVALIGLARLALFHVGPDIDAGRLAPVLEELNPGDREDIHAVYLGQSGPLPAHVRAFIDFLSEQIRISDLRLVRSPEGTWRVAPAGAPP